MSRRLFAIFPVPVSALLALLTPVVASACAVCGGGTDRERIAFLISTAFLSLLPLALIFGGLWWLRRKASHAMRDEFIDRDELALQALGETEVPPAGLQAQEQPART